MKGRKVGETFKYNNKVYIVKKGEYDWRKLRMCDERCAFHDNQSECRMNIKITGDCQPKYRGDNTPVYFEIYGQESKRKTV